MLNLIFNTIYTLLVLSLCCGIIIPLLLLLRGTALKRASGNVRYYLWLPVLLLALVPLKINIPDSQPQSPPIGTQVSHAQIKEAEGTAPAAVLPSYTVQDNTTAEKTEKQSILKALESAGDSLIKSIKSNAGIITTALFAVWLFGFIVIALRTAAGYVKAVRRLGEHSQPSELRRTLLLDLCREEVGVKGPVRLRTVEDGHILSPCLAGLLRPTIFMSQADMKREDGELRLIFVHELVHIIRLDVLYSAFSGLVCALHWFNPLFGVLSRRRYEDCEFSCDEKVLRISGKTHSRTYINMLFDMLSAGGADNKASAMKAPEIALFLERSSDINFIKRRFINMKRQGRRGAVLIAVSFTLAASIFSTLFVSSCGVPDVSGALTGTPSRFDNPIIRQAVYEYYGLDRSDAITDEQLDGIKSVDIQFVSMTNRLSSDGSESSVFADISVNGVRLGLLPEYVSSDRFENIIKPALNELDKNYSNKPNYNRMLAYYLLVDKNDTKWTDDDIQNWNIDYLNEFLNKFPMLNQAPLYILDCTANEREKQKLITILNAAGLCDGLIVEDSFTLSDMKLFANLEQLTINGEDNPVSKDMPYGINKTDLNAQPYALVEIDTDVVINPLFNYPTVEPKEREAPTGDNYLIAFNNLSLQSALLEYFVLDQGQTNTELTKEHVDLITSIKISVNKDATELINKDGFGTNKNAYYLVYEINGQSMGILPPRISRSYFESRFIHYADSEESQQKLLTYYLVKDPSLVEDEESREELLLMYPDSNDNPYYMLDPTISEREVLMLLDCMTPSPINYWHIWQKDTPYNTSDLELFENLETFELSDELK